MKGVFIAGMLGVILAGLALLYGVVAKILLKMFTTKEKK